MGGESKKSLLNEEAGAKEDGGFQFFFNLWIFQKCIMGCPFRIDAHCFRKCFTHLPLLCVHVLWKGGVVSIKDK